MGIESRLPCYNGEDMGRLLREMHQTVVPRLDNSNQDNALAQISHAGAEEAAKLLEQGFEQQQTRQFEAALQSFEEALKLYTKLPNQWGAGRALGGLGLTVYALGDFQQVVEYASKSLAIACEVKDLHLEGQLREILGNSYRHLGQPLKAIEQGQQSLTIMRQLGNQLGEVAALNNLGLAYKALGDLPRALAYQQQSLDVVQTLSNRQMEEQILRNLSNVCYALGNYAQAVEYYKQRLAIARELGDYTLEGVILRNLSNVCYALGDYPH
jgi:tetratricopeptide (TPR) repeat protein